MKTVEQQKSELCDEYVNALLSIKSTVELNEMEIVLMKKYDEITQQKPLSQDPYIDEIFSGLMLKLLKRVYDKTNFQISELPHVSWMCKLRGFGKAMEKEYTEVMIKYNLTDKI